MAKGQAQRAQSGNQSKSRPQSSPPAGIERNLGIRDETYDIISVLYHSLQGADTISQYLGDVTRAGNADIRTFLEETQSEYVARAQAAKQLLASRLEADEGEDAEEDEDEDEE